MPDAQCAHENNCDHRSYSIRVRLRERLERGGNQRNPALDEGSYMCHVHRQRLLVRRHRRKVQVELRTAIETSKVIQRERLCQLARPISAIVVKDDRVAVFDRSDGSIVTVRDDRWHDELIAAHVRLGGMIVIPLDRVLGALESRTIRQGDRAKGLLDAPPTVVA